MEESAPLTSRGPSSARESSRWRPAAIGAASLLVVAAQTQLRGAARFGCVMVPMHHPNPSQLRTMRRPTSALLASLGGLEKVSADGGSSM